MFAQFLLFFFYIRAVFSVFDFSLRVNLIAFIHFYIASGAKLSFASVFKIVIGSNFCN